MAAKRPNPLTDRIARAIQAQDAWKAAQGAADAIGVIPDAVGRVAQGVQDYAYSRTPEQFGQDVYGLAYRAADDNMRGFTQNPVRHMANQAFSLSPLAAIPPAIDAYNRVVKAQQTGTRPAWRDAMGDVGLAAFGALPGAGGKGKAATKVLKEGEALLRDAEGSRNLLRASAGYVPGQPIEAVPSPRIANDAGYPISGPALSSRAATVKKQMAAMPKGYGPLDLSPLPNTAPQFNLDRKIPKKVSPRMQDALANPTVVDGVAESIKNGIGLNAQTWYHTEPIRQAWIRELGPTEGPIAFKDFMDMVSATSPGLTVPDNYRTGSHYYVQQGNVEQFAKPLPQGYGAKTQNLHISNANQILGGGYNVFKNPKPAGFSENMQGNLQPVAFDTHAVRNIGMRTQDPRWLATSTQVKVKNDPAPGSVADRFGQYDPKKGLVIFTPRSLVESGKLSMDEVLGMPTFWDSVPGATEYKAGEEFYGNLGRDFRLEPAEAQSAAWSGAADLTGLGTPPEKTAAEMFNERVQYTAMMRGEDPQDTLRYLIRRQKPLLGLGLAVGGASALGAQQDEQPVY